jgi:hypothetical protein
LSEGEAGEIGFGQQLQNSDKAGGVTDADQQDTGGSSVPACPVRKGRTSRWMRLTASREVMPAGLSSTSIPEDV